MPLMQSASLLFFGVALLQSILARADLPIGVATCDSTPVERSNIRRAITSSFTAKGYTSHSGSYSCLAESGGSGAGNPESNTCTFRFPLLDVPLLRSFSKLPVFQLESISDIIVFIGCSPPRPGPVYYGFTPYLAGFNLEDLALMKPFGQITDTLNQVVMNSTSSQTNPWNSTTVIVLTGDQVSRDDLNEALEGAGIPATAINLITLPSQILNIGIGPTKNVFLLGARAGPFVNASQRESHLHDATEPVLLFRSATRSKPANPLPVVPRRNRTGATTELGLKAAQQAVIAGVEKWAAASKWRVTGLVAMRPQLRDGVYSNGTECITNRSTAGCAGDTDDAGYYDSAPLDGLTSDDMDVIVGANSQRTGKGVYSSCAVYTLPTGGSQSSVLGGAAMSSLEYGGSATHFAPSLPSVGELYAVKVTYGGCAQQGAWCLNATQTSKAHQLVYVSRVYLDNSTATGPDPDQLLPPIVVRLRKEAGTQFEFV